MSRRIASDKESRRLRALVNEVRPKGSGFIVRTAAEDASDQELRDDVDFLARLWAEIDRRQDSMSGAGLVYADLDLALRVVRDLLREDTSEVMIDDEEQHERVKKFTLAFLPRFAERIKRYETTVGRSLLSEILPAGLSFELLNKPLKKKEISKLINIGFRRCGLRETVIFADKLMQAGFCEVMDTEAMFRKAFAEMQAKKLLPPR